MDYNSVEFFDRFVQFCCSELQKSLTAVMADDITYVINDNLSSTKLLRWIVFIILVMYFEGYCQ